MSCRHRVSFAARWVAKNWVQCSRTTEAIWLCPACRRWVAGMLDEAPVEVTPVSGIFLKKEGDHE